MQIAIRPDSLGLVQPGGINVSVQAPDYQGRTAFTPETNRHWLGLRSGTEHASATLQDGDSYLKAQRRYVKNHFSENVRSGGALLKGMRAANDALDVAWRNFLKPRNVPGDYRAMTCLNILQDLPNGKRIERMVAHDEAGFIGLEFFNILGMDPASRPQIERMIALANLTRAHLSSPAARQQTMADPLGRTPNAEYAARMADTELAAWDAQNGQIQAGLNWFDSSLNFIAVLGDQAKPAVFEQMTKAS